MALADYNYDKLTGLVKAVMTFSGVFKGGQPAMPRPLGTKKFPHFWLLKHHNFCNSLQKSFRFLGTSCIGGMVQWPLW